MLFIVFLLLGLSWFICASTHSGQKEPTFTLLFLHSFALSSCLEEDGGNKASHGVTKVTQVLSQDAIVTSVDKLSANLADFTQALNSFAKDQT